MRSMSKNNPIVVIILFVIALGFVGYGAFNYFTEKAKYDDLIKSCTATTDGEVISCESHIVKETTRVSKHNTKTVSHTYYLTKASFKVDGKEYICELDSKTEFPVGAMTQLQYDPSDPYKRFIGSSPMNTYQNYLRPMIIGGVLALGGVVTLIRMRQSS